MAQNYIQDGKVITRTLSVTVAAGAVVVMNDLQGVALTGGVSGDQIEVALEGVFQLAKNNGVAINQGDLLYWDTTPGELTKTALGNLPFGYAWEDAAQAATVAKVKIGGLARIGAIA